MQSPKLASTEDVGQYFVIRKNGRSAAAAMALRPMHALRIFAMPSPMITLGAWVLPVVTRGMIEISCWRAQFLDGRRAVTHWASCELLDLRYDSVTVEPDAIFRERI